VLDPGSYRVLGHSDGSLGKLPIRGPTSLQGNGEPDGIALAVQRRTGRIIHEKECGEASTVRLEHPIHLGEVAVRIGREEMGEDRCEEDEVEDLIIEGQSKRVGTEASLGIVDATPHIQMLEVEVRMGGGQVGPTPFDCRLPDVEAPVLARRGKISGQGPRHPPHAASQIEHPFVAMQLGEVDEVPQEFPTDHLEIPAATVEETPGRGF
jgi:hypothetical protein